MPRKCMRSKDELKAILAAGSLLLAEPYDASKSYPKNAYVLTECSKCHTIAHYTLKYIIEKTTSDEPVCRACFWHSWYEGPGDPSRNAKRYIEHLASQASSDGDTELAGYLRTQDPVVLIQHVIDSNEAHGEEGNIEFLRSLCPPEPLTEKQARREASDNGFDLIDLLDRDKPGCELFVVRCRSCGKRSVERRCDIGWSCSCKTHPNTPTLYAPGESHLLCESEEPCLSWWAHDQNDEKAFESVRTHAHVVATWRCPRCGHLFNAKILEMTGPTGPHCPKCIERQHDLFDEEVERYKHTPVSDVPELMEAWNDERDPHEVMVWATGWKGMCPGDGQYGFECTKGHHAWSFPYTYLKEGCPFCKAEQSKNEGESLAESSPELAAEWDQPKNGRLTPENLRINSKRKTWWKCLACGYEWEASPRERNKVRGQACPKCGKILGSLAWSFPHLAEEWDPTNPVSAWEIRAHSNPPFKPKWICANNPDHRWAATLVSRVDGSGCPECTNSGKSRIELRYFAVACKVFGDARSGVRVDDAAFDHTWSIDILTWVDRQRIAIEYDGAHWHADGVETDTRKSMQLLHAGYIVIRLREDDLPVLDISSDAYHEIRVNSQAPRPEHVMEQIRTLLS